MPAIYTHCRQFPHLHGRSDGEIRGIVRSALDKHAAYRTAFRARNVIVLAALLGVAAVYQDAPRQQFGLALMLAGGITTTIVLAWNFLWVNLVLFRLTADELHRGSE